MKGGLVVAVVAILAVVAAVQRGEAVTCGQVEAALRPCVNFLMGGEADPPELCCNGVRAVKAMVITPNDKRTTCGCVKTGPRRASPENVVSRSPSPSPSPAPSTVAPLVENHR